MIRRQKSMRFLGGFYAFPGGKVDPDDGGSEILGRCHGITRARAERLVPPEVPALLAAEGWHLDLGSFRYLSHFITPPSSPIRFTARFFLAPVPPGQSPRLFAEEASEGFWVEPSEGFRRHRNGEWAMAEPADCGLGYLAQFDDLESVWAAHEDGRHKFHGILDRVEAAGVNIRRGSDGRTPTAS